MCVCIRVCVGVHVCLDYTSYRMFQNSFQRTDLPLNPYNFDCTPNRTFHNTPFVTQYSLYSADFWNNLYNPNYKMFQNSYINLPTMFTVSQTQSNVINISITFETTCINYIKNRPTGCFKIRYIILLRCFSLSTLDQFFWSNLYNTPNYRVFSKRRSFKFAIITNNQRGTVKNLRKQYGGNDGD